MMERADQRRDYKERIAGAFRIRKERVLLVPSLARHQIAITRLTSEPGSPDRVMRLTSEQAFLLLVDLAPMPGAQTPAGGLAILDLSLQAELHVPSGSDRVIYHLPRTTLNALADESGMPRIGMLRMVDQVADPVIRQLTQMILPFLDRPADCCDVVLDSFQRTFCGYVLKTYSAGQTVELLQGGLAPWQKRRVLQLLHQDLGTALPLVKIASECKLSVSQMTRSFKKSFGHSVHRYLLLQRVERAKAMLSHGIDPLPEVALRSGFSDQAAFSRTFGAIVGTSPGRWRRERSVRSRATHASSYVQLARHESTTEFAPPAC
ncbi:helix-turn-helix domain-containing protein [Granulicella tundricola]|nr:AraC family transcriptional regulator [Granulicella tundricola]